MLTTHCVGIDLGTTYSCIAYLNERGVPVTIPNEEGELCTPSVVMYEKKKEVVGTEALRNAIVYPQRVIQNAKRFLGDQYTHWVVNGQQHSPVDVSAAILRKILRDAGRQIGPIERAAITVPAQFSDGQRKATLQAGMKAGLKQVDIINEPVAAALCYVLGKEGLWFAEMAEQQRLLVFDLRRESFDLSLVKYHKNDVSVIASSSDLHLGGIDWNEALLNAVADQYMREFQDDPRRDPDSYQALMFEVEQCVRTLTTRPRAAMICQHAGKRKTYQIEQTQFHELTAPLVFKSEEIIRQLLKSNKLDWANVDAVLTTGASACMPMIRSMLQKLSGRTLTSLSPDQAIAHGAAYFAGMLLTNNDFAKPIQNETQVASLKLLSQTSGIAEPDLKVSEERQFSSSVSTYEPTPVSSNSSRAILNDRFSVGVSNTPNPEVVLDHKVMKSEGPEETSSDEPQTFSGQGTVQRAPRKSVVIVPDEPQTFSRQPTHGRSPGGLPRRLGHAFQEPQKGEILAGMFQLLEPIGRGAMGVVWKARDTSGNRDVCIKLLPSEVQDDETELARVRSMFEKVHALQHEYLCPLYLIGNDARHRAFLVMKLINGVTLGSFQQMYAAQHGTFRLGDVVLLLGKVALALDYVHRQKLVHRDVKPANILVAGNGRDVQLVDLGLAAEIRSSLTRVSQSVRDLAGTAPYMAPEQWRGGALDGRADQYALTNVAYQLLTGRLPFDCPNDVAWMHCALNEPIAPIAEIPEHVNAALLKGLAKSRDDRFATCAELVRALRRGGKGDG